MSQAAYLFPESGLNGAVSIAQKLQLSEYQQNKINNDLVHAIKPMHTDKNGGYKSNESNKVTKRKESTTPSAEN